MQSTELRWLTESERALAYSIFRDAIHYSRVKIIRRKWFPFHLRSVTMAPDGNIWFHPKSPNYRLCFADASLALQSHFIHEMVHVWQHQNGVYLPLARYPFSPYRYNFAVGKPFQAYNIEQQAELVRDAFMILNNASPRNKITLDDLRHLLPFHGPLISES